MKQVEFIETAEDFESKTWEVLVTEPVYVEEFRTSRFRTYSEAKNDSTFTSKQTQNTCAAHLVCRNVASHDASIVSVHVWIRTSRFEVPFLFWPVRSK